MANNQTKFLPPLSLQQLADAAEVYFAELDAAEEADRLARKIVTGRK